ncbi:NAD-dependent succinate-semialdehyde dehydrogenase [Guyparkeria hydrothermalis]|uniref:NAD-dependent succinate-semialdehyde dehydrogenase n=1 Tax=Guyparkeria TaxID=2035712 RepID=UPI0010AD542D|nr:MULTISPECIES: NAD-dependent succinate-semialdehyde dehydrogenase [Guyparkeria]MCL7752083.1 NAD-dependent succinate-semialdehyde dehydrogenase [Guyparkeria hydrothermalis]TKA91280.1 NAD-dependent succinate-semialdehyde dehydrogenase [Guyparkeria sp. SB14A]
MSDDLVGTIRSTPLFREECFIDGQWVSAGEAERQAVVNPANGETIGSVPRLGVEPTRQAIEAAERAWPAWREQTAEARGSILYRWYELMLDNEEILARIMTLEQGKPLAESAGEIRYAASFLKWFAEEARRAYGRTIPAAKPGQQIVVLRQPIGVCAAITPWNFPSSMITRKAAAALAAGCPMLVKPASATPFSALALAALAEKAGVPAGVFNVVTGSASEIAGEMTANPAVRKISFTGSTEVGSQLMREAAGNVQKLSLELGGNAPFIVFDDADLDAAVEGAIAAKFRNTGQTCVCVNRFYVQDGVYEPFVVRLKARIEGLRLGDGMDPDSDVTPLIDKAAADKVMAQIEEATGQGATLMAGGQRDPRGENYVVPTLLTEIRQSMRVMQEETFGPLVAVSRFTDEVEAVALANDTPFGLAAYFYSENVHRVWRVAEGIEAGMIGINTGLISNAAAPFGGVKASGLGREGAVEGLDEYLETKYLLMG